MPNENGEWILYGLDDNDPKRIKTWNALIKVIDKIGFLPLFANQVEGFSVEEMTAATGWWSGDAKRDPWMWREIITESHQAVYGKFFDKKAGFISLEWLPYFANWRRDGYDFDALWDDQKASYRAKKIMDLFPEKPKTEWFSFEIKEKAGFGKGGLKNFDGLLTQLQMQTYLVPKEFRKRKNKKGEEYGWSIAVMATPESIWGKKIVRKAYKEDPEKSRERIFQQVKNCFPLAAESDIRKILKP